MSADVAALRRFGGSVLAKSRDVDRPGVLAMLDQAAISGTNFISGVVLARNLETEAFGQWVIANLLLWLLLALQNGLVLQPMNVISSPLEHNAFGRFLRASMPLQLTFTGVSGVALLGVSHLWEPLRPIALPLVAAAACMQGQEVCRRALMCRAHVKAALLNDLVSFGLQAVVLLLAVLVVPLTVHLALWCVAATSFLALLLGIVQLRRFSVRGRDSVKAVTAQILRLGWWAGGAVGLAHLSGQAYLWLVTGILGLAGTAGLGAILQILGALNLMTRPLENYFLPRVARAHELEGPAGLARGIRSAAAFSLPICIVFALALLLIPETVLRAVSGDRYVQHSEALRIFGLGALLVVPIRLLRLNIGARHLQRFLPGVEILAGLVLCTLAIPLVAGSGLQGAGIANVAALMVELVLLALVSFRHRTKATDGTSPIALTGP